MIEKVTIKREIEGFQWDGNVRDLPPGCFICKPEVQWSAGHDLIYFTYADLHPSHWMGTAKLLMPDDGSAPSPGSLESGVVVTAKDGSKYWRKVLPFAFWSVKSEQSIKGDYKPVFLERDGDAALLELFADYRYVERWPREELPPRIEYRALDGAYGRGYRPFYMKPSDWLLIEGLEMHSGKIIRVVADDEFQKMRA